MGCICRCDPILPPGTYSFLFLLQAEVSDHSLPMISEGHFHIKPDFFLQILNTCCPKLSQPCYLLRSIIIPPQNITDFQHKLKPNKSNEQRPFTFLFFLPGSSIIACLNLHNYPVFISVIGQSDDFTSFAGEEVIQPRNIFRLSSSLSFQKMYCSYWGLLFHPIHPDILLLAW